MIKKIVFIITWPLSIRDYNRFGAPVFIQNGFDVVFFDLTPFINPSLYKKIVDADTAELKERHLFKSRKEAVAAIRGLSSEHFVLMMDRYNFKNFGIYRALSRSKASYAVSITNAIPTSIPNFLKKVECNLSLPKIMNFIVNLPFRISFSKFLGIREPKFWLAGGVQSPKNYATHYPFGKNTEILWLHTMDFDIYLEKNRRKLPSAPDKAVFLDDGAIHFIGDGDPPYLTKGKYFPSLCRFFDLIEKEQNVEITIAAHPRTKHPARPEYFGRRITVYNKTLEMIEESKFVITHASTAVNFAVLFKKPVLFIVTDEHERNSKYNTYLIRSIAACLNKKPINIDHIENLKWGYELTVNEASYNNYRNRFIKKDGSEEINSWQIVCNKLKRLVEK